MLEDHKVRDMGPFLSPSVTSEVVLDHLSVLNAPPRDRRAREAAEDTSFTLPFLADLIAARSPVEMPLGPIQHLVIGEPLSHVTSISTVNGWRWLRDEQSNSTQSVTRLLVQEGRRKMMLDVYSDVEQVDSIVYLGSKDFLPATEFSRVNRLMQHLSQTGAHVKGWVPFPVVQ